MSVWSLTILNIANVNSVLSVPTVLILSICMCDCRSNTVAILGRLICYASVRQKHVSMHLSNLLLVRIPSYLCKMTF